MSSFEPAKDSKQSPQSADFLLSEKEREQANKLGANPMDLIGTTESKSYIKGLIEEMLPTSKAFQNLAATMAQPVGSFLIVPEDLTANAAEYVYTDSRTGLTYLYANGAAVSQTTYADLYAWWGASKWAADSGGNFSLPDTRGRALWLAGTNTNTDLGDTDGVAEASREPKHQHVSTSLTITGAIASESAHTHGAGSYTYGHPTGNSIFAAGAGFAVDNTTPTAVSGTSGAGSSHTHGNGSLDVGGTAGSGMSGSDAVAHIVIGSLLVRF